MKCSLWLYPPASVGGDLKSLITELSVQGDGINPTPFDPHVTVVGGIDCQDEEDSSKLCNFLEGKLKGKFGRGVDCRFHPNLVSVEGKDTPLQWNQALVAVLHQTPSFMALVDASRQALGKPPPIQRKFSFAPPLQEPHLSLYYGTHEAPNPDCVEALKPFVATELGLWMTEPSGLEGVHEWKELGRISLV